MPHVHSPEAAAKRRARAVALGFLAPAAPRWSFSVARRLQAAGKSLAFHEAHCQLIGQNVHSASAASALAKPLTGPVDYAAARRAHRAAGKAKHDGWVVEDPLWTNDPWPPPLCGGSAWRRARACEHEELVSRLDALDHRLCQLLELVIDKAVLMNHMENLAGDVAFPAPRQIGLCAGPPSRGDMIDSGILAVPSLSEVAVQYESSSRTAVHAGTQACSVHSSMIDSGILAVPTTSELGVQFDISSLTRLLVHTGVQTSPEHFGRWIELGPSDWFLSTYLDGTWHRLLGVNYRRLVDRWRRSDALFDEAECCFCDEHSGGFHDPARTVDINIRYFLQRMGWDLQLPRL